MNLLLTTTGGAIVDIVALILFVGFAINGAKKGFIKSLISTFGSIISLFVAILLCSSVANFLENQFGFATQIGSWLNALVR